MQMQKVVEGLGYTAKEAKVYLAALALGEAHISDIAEKIKLPLSSVQVIADKLHQNGLLNFYIRKRYKYWVAVQPSRLLAQQKEREDALRDILPELEQLRRRSTEKPHVRILEGVEEIRQMYDDILETKHHILGAIPWDDWVRLLGRGFMEDFIERRMRHFLRIRLLAPKTEIALGLHANDSKELRETRFLPEHLSLSTSIFIYGEKIAIVSLNKALPTATIIEDAAVADTFALFFEDLWGHSASE